MGELSSSLTRKQLDFIGNNDAKIEVLEGTTMAAKTTVGICFKFISKVMRSKHKLHLLAGLDVGTIEQNIINCEYGITDIWGNLVTYHSNGNGNFKFPHIEVTNTRSGGENKFIRIVGYKNKDKWEKALGGQFGCVAIDEVDRASIELVQQSTMRCEYAIMTLNPNNPDLQVYKEFINPCRPVDDWEHTVPHQILKQLYEVEAKDGYMYWFFHYDDNQGVSEAFKEVRLSRLVRGSQLEKSMKFGLRGRAEGLIWGDFNWSTVVKSDFSQYKFKKFSIGVDTSFSDMTEDSITVMGIGITECGKLCILKELVINNKNLSESEQITPSDMPELLVNYAKEFEKEWGYARYIYIDNASTPTIKECQKWAKKNIMTKYQFVKSYKKTDYAKNKTARVDAVSGWLSKGSYLINSYCVKHREEMRGYAWATGGTTRKPEDRDDHTIDGVSYGWLPYSHLIIGE
jgi:PBSX family phage terminase large subunit